MASCGTFNIHSDLFTSAKTLGYTNGGSTLLHVMAFICVHPLKASVRMYCTLVPSVTFSKFVQPLKNQLYTIVTLFPMVASRREVIPAKGDDWMLHFMVMEVRPEQ